MDTKMNTENMCICGCLTPTHSKFAPGHDAKLHGAVLRIFRHKEDPSILLSSEVVRIYLASAPWMTRAMKRAFHLSAKNVHVNAA